MANISSAFGYLTIRAKEKSTVEAVVEGLNLLGSGDYYTALYNQSEIVSDGNGGYVLETEFSGYGRWNYANNIEQMGRWMKAWIQEKGLKELEDKLIHSVWEIEFDFADEECGCQLLLKEVMEVTHLYGHELNELIIRDISCEEYNYSMANLILLGFLDPSSDELIIDRFGDDLYDGNAEQIAEELEEVFSSREILYCFSEKRKEELRELMKQAQEMSAC